jgi:branched-chain amino acid transport system permease protein
MFNLLWLEGSQTLGRGYGFWIGVAAVAAGACALPLILDEYAVNNASFFLIWTGMALGLSVIWGYAGILSLGQTAFFGAAGYIYAIAATNWGAGAAMTLAAFSIAIVATVCLSLLMAYFMFYGGIDGVSVGIVTLSVTLIFETFMTQTSGPQWVVGSARLNGFNGMSGMPSLAIPFFGGSDLVLEGRAFYWFELAVVFFAYFALRILLNGPFGYILIAIRESPLRARALGYDVRLFQVIAFALGAALTAVSGVFYTTWGGYITPSSMGMNAAILPIVWVAAGGRKDIGASLVGCLFLVWLSQTLAVTASRYALIVMGLILLVSVLFAPNGFVIGFRDLFRVEKSDAGKGNSNVQ